MSSSQPTRGHAPVTPAGLPPVIAPHQAERVVARLRPHARRLFWPSLALIAIAGGAGYFYGSFPDPWENSLVLAGAGLLALLLFLLPLGVWLSRRYVITTRRIILRRGLFVRVKQELLHSRGYDVSIRRGPLQLAFRSGDVRINSGLERPVVLRDIPRADAVQEALQDLMENSQNAIAARRQQTDSVPDETGVWGDR